MPDNRDPPDWEEKRCSFCGKEFKTAPAMWVSRRRALPLLICKKCWEEHHYIKRMNEKLDEIWKEITDD